MAKAKRNYSDFFAICKRHGWDYKEKVVEFTNGATESLSSLSDGEYRELLLLAKRFSPIPEDWEPPEGDEQRKKTIAIARDMRWDVRGKEAMMQRIDNWCLTQTKYKKPLNKLSIDELNKVLHIFEHEVKPSFLKGL